jgi:hypothetical protein
MTPEPNAMNVHVGAVFDSLDLQVSKGRTVAEAAGEAQWIAEVEEKMGVLSHQTREERIRVIHNWLAEKVGGTEEIDLYKLVAKVYAGFLQERVSFEAGRDSVAMLESAWHEWRTATRG